MSQLDRAQLCLTELARSRDRSANETVMRQVLVAGLAELYPAPGRPWWIDRHIKGAEHGLTFGSDGADRRGRADSVVGLTAIEYEPDLRLANRFAGGRYQVQQYCTGLLNEGADADRVRGVLSDGVEWRAYRVRVMRDRVPGGFGVEDIELVDLEHLDCAGATPRLAERWLGFLVRYLGRSGTRPLTAAGVASYLGFESAAGAAFLHTLGVGVRGALACDLQAQTLLERTWTPVVMLLGGDDDRSRDLYVRELYLSLLARLICANVLAQRSLSDDDEQLIGILDGGHFEALGLLRLVEYDYFGWLTRPPHVGAILPLARALQADLSAFDFSHEAEADMFGHLLSSLATRAQRLMLGQEWTPGWLADRIAERLFANLPQEQQPRFLDMCCGSGVMLVAVGRQARLRLKAAGIAPGSAEAIQTIVDAATGFDIDPLAVMLARVNWVVANRDWLEPFDGTRPVSVPIYQADALFALAPVFDHDADPDGDYPVRLLDRSVRLPRFLVTARAQPLYDGLLDRLDSLATHCAANGKPVPDRSVLESLVADATSASAVPLSDSERHRLSSFALEIIGVFADLQARGLNGIWPFILRNSYRPGMVAGRFNGLIANPPWMALSKIAGNPFESALTRRADRYALRPQGSAFLHLEMATTFLAHAIDHFLAPGAVVACVLPDTVRNGSHHDPFRAQVDRREGVDVCVSLAMDELWRVDAGTFRNRAVVLFGRKGEPIRVDEWPGQLASAHAGSRALVHYRRSFGGRSVWSENPPGDGIPGGYSPGFFRQGADIMPRRLVMVTVRARGGDQTSICTPMMGDPGWYLVSAAKKHKSFSFVPRTIPDRFVHACLISQHVGPYVITELATVVLPFLRTPAHTWRVAAATDIAMHPALSKHFDAIVQASDVDSLDDLAVDILDYRGKLQQQQLPLDAWLVVYGAGGGIPAAACARVRDLSDRAVVIDQTLYWATVSTEDEAVYIVGLINNDALRERIEPFVPEGEFGDRHLHTLPSKAVPEWDPTNEAHIEVARTSRAIRDRLRELRSDEYVATLFAPQLGLGVRRRRLRALIRSLDVYPAYDSACRALYARLR